MAEVVCEEIYAINAIYKDAYIYGEELGMLNCKEDGIISTPKMFG